MGRVGNRSGEMERFHRFSCTAVQVALCKLDVLKLMLEGQLCKVRPGLLSLSLLQALD